MIECETCILRTLAETSALQVSLQPRPLAEVVSQLLQCAHLLALWCIYIFLLVLPLRFRWLQTLCLSLRRDSVRREGGASLGLPPGCMMHFCYDIGNDSDKGLVVLKLRQEE